MGDYSNGRERRLKSVSVLVQIQNRLPILRASRKSANPGGCKPLSFGNNWVGTSLAHHPLYEGADNFTANEAKIPMAKV